MTIFSWQPPDPYAKRCVKRMTQNVFYMEHFAFGVFCFVNGIGAGEDPRGYVGCEGAGAAALVARLSNQSTVTGSVHCMPPLHAGALQGPPLYVAPVAFPFSVHWGRSPEVETIGKNGTKSGIHVHPRHTARWE